MLHKVTFDTNIFIAGSIVETTGELGFPIKHKFYDYAINLIQYIRKNPAKRIGITTNFIETEAYKTLSRAVEKELVESEFKKHMQDIEKEHDVFSALLNRCSDNMGKIFTYLIKEPVDENAVNKIYRHVDSFYDDLKNEAKEVVEQLKIKGYMRSRTTARRYKKDMLEIYSQQDRWPYAQLLNLIMYKDVEPNDKWILSQVIYLHRIYQPLLGPDLKSYIASTDYHFSPIRKDGRPSSYISDRIKSRFDIICNWPDEIYKIIKK